MRSACHNLSIQSTPRKWSVHVTAPIAKRIYLAIRICKQDFLFAYLYMFHLSWRHIIYICNI